MNTGTRCIPEVTRESRFQDGVTRNAGFTESPGTSGSRGHTELRVPDQSHPQIRISGVNRNSGFPESHGFPESTGTPGTWSRTELRAETINPGSRNSGITDSSGTPDSPEIWVPEVTRNSGFLGSPGTPGLRSHLKMWVRGARWKPELSRTLGSRRQSDSLSQPEHRFSHLPRNPGSRSHRNFGFP